MNDKVKELPQYITSKGEAAMNWYNEFAQFRVNFKVLRAYNLMTLDDLSELLNIRPVRINDYELGRCHPNFDEIRIIAKHFNCTIDQLLYGSLKIEWLANN
jgi:DNA-binding XRE family transcriptional regulator